jgi:hypothetical protein
MSLGVTLIRVWWEREREDGPCHANAVTEDGDKVRGDVARRRMCVGVEDVIGHFDWAWYSVDDELSK